MPGRETLVYSAPRAASSPDDRPMFPPGSMTVSASGIFKILFWIHQVLLRVPAATIGLDLVSRGQTEGILAAIGLLLAWIGGALMWGFAALIHQKRNPSE